MANSEQNLNYLPVNNDNFSFESFKGEFVPEFELVLLIIIVSFSE